MYSIFQLFFQRSGKPSLLFLVSLLCTVIAKTHATDESTVLPAEEFYRLPSLTNIHISPDGTHILALKNVGEETVVMTMDLATGKVFYPTKTDNKKFKIRWIDWGNNDRLIMSLIFSDNAFGDTVKFNHTRLIAMDANQPSKMLNLIKPVDNASYISQFQDNVIGKIPGEPDNILVSIDNNSAGHQTVYKININDAKTTMIKREDESFSWIADRQGVVRVGTSYDDAERKTSFKILDPRTNKWTKAWEYKVLDNPAITPLGFGKDATELYLLADYEGRQALYKADLAQEGYPWKLMLSDPDYDIQGSLIYSSKLNDVVGIYYYDHSNGSIFFNPEFKAFQGGLDNVLPASTNRITNMSDDGRKYIVYASNDTTPGTVYFGDRDTKQLSPIATQYPNLTDKVLVKKQKLIYKARDGLELEGYLSLPKNFHQPIATIILPHGGPMAEDGIGFDAFSAFFTNRGYAVFQPNFRGSSGRGHDFMMKAVGAMGLEMQDDLEDAAQFLIEKKYADAQKMCIVGASYGGYAALMGATKTPDLFKCAISFAGISDIKKLRDSAFHTMNKNIIRQQLGSDSDQLKRTSPINMVDKIKIPILLIHAKDDAVVPVEQSRLMADELKRQHKIYEYIELEGGSHNLDYLPHRKQTFEAMDEFLKKYLPL